MKYILGMVTLCIFVMGCMKQVFPDSERWEGINNNTLRIYAHLEIPYNYKEKDIEQKMPEQLMKAGVKRCVSLLDIYVASIMPSADRELYTTLRMELYKITQKGRFRETSCDENYCSAFIDFDIKELLAAISRNKDNNTNKNKIIHKNPR